MRNAWDCRSCISCAAACDAAKRRADAALCRSGKGRRPAGGRTQPRAAAAARSLRERRTAPGTLARRPAGVTQGVIVVPALGRGRAGCYHSAYVEAPCPEMSLDALSALYAAIGVIMFWLALGVAGLVRVHDERFVFRILFPLGSLGGAGLTLVGLAGLTQPAASLVLPLGLPDLPFHLRLDPLSSFFLALLGLAAAGISLFSAASFPKTAPAPPALPCLHHPAVLVSLP